MVSKNLLIVVFSFLMGLPAYSSIIINNKTAGADDTNALVYQTSSVQFHNGRLYLLAVHGRRASGGIQAAPTISGGGITWQQVNEITFDIGSPDRRIVVYRGLVTSGATTGIVTITWGGSNLSSCDWIIDEVTGIDTSGTNGSGAIVQSGVTSVESGSSLTINLSAFSATHNATWAAFGLSYQGASGILTPGSGFSIVGASQSGSEAHSIASQKKIPNASDTSVDGSFASSSSAVGAVALEIKAANPNFFRRRMQK